MLRIVHSGKVLSILLLISSFAFTGCGGGSKDDPCMSLKIAGGNECEVQPLSVALLQVGNQYCTGAFVSKRDILTAAHCVPVGSGEIVVVTKSFSERTTTVVRHPGYIAGGPSANDVAIVTISHDAPVTPVPLLESQAVEDGDLVIAYGYGVDEYGRDVVSRVERGGMPLKSTYLDVYAVNADWIRTISDGGGDTCAGDSGGPVLKQSSGKEYGIVAVVNYGPNLCKVNDGLPSANTNVQTTRVNDFILKYVPGARVI